MPCFETRCPNKANSKPEKLWPLLANLTFFRIKLFVVNGELSPLANFFLVLYRLTYFLIFRVPNVLESLSTMVICGMRLGSTFTL